MRDANERIEDQSEVGSMAEAVPKEFLRFENRAWDKADIKRLVSNRIELPYQLRYQFPRATSAVLEVHYHYVLDGYVITVYGYSAREKIEGKQDPCYGGFMKAHHDHEGFLVFPDKKKGLPAVKDFLEAWGYEVEFQ